jgi:hypothetical protein
MKTWGALHCAPTLFEGVACALAKRSLPASRRALNDDEE